MYKKNIARIYIILLIDIIEEKDLEAEVDLEKVEVEEVVEAERVAEKAVEDKIINKVIHSCK